MRNSGNLENEPFKWIWVKWRPVIGRQGHMYMKSDACKTTAKVRPSQGHVYKCYRIVVTWNTCKYKNNLLLRYFFPVDYTTFHLIWFFYYVYCKLMPWNIKFVGRLFCYERRLMWETKTGFSIILLTVIMSFNPLNRCIQI